MYLSTNRHCVFYYTWGQCCQSDPSGTLSRLWFALSGLAYPKAGALNFNLYSLYLL